MNTNTASTSTWDKIMMAITFAEAGEVETAKQIMNQRKSNRPESRTRKESTQRPELRF